MTSAVPEGPDPEKDRPAKAPTTRIPRTDASVAHLQIRRGLDSARIVADPRLGDLLHGRWRRTPEVVADDGAVTLTYPRFRWSRWGTNEITLNASIPWDITVHGAMHRVTADLTRLKLRSLTVGGAFRLVLLLGEANGEVRIDLRSADRVTIRRPEATPVRLRISHGASRLVVDNQSYNALGGETVLDTAPVLRNAYHVDVKGARRLRVTTGLPEETWRRR